MAKAISVRLDEGEIREQVESAVNQALEEVSWKLRHAADALFPEFLEDQERYIESEIERRVAERLSDDK